MADTIKQKGKASTNDACTQGKCESVLILKVFGLVNGDRVAVLIDSSNSNLGFGRAIEFQDSLLVWIKVRIC